MRPAIEVWRAAYDAFTDFYCHTTEKDPARVIEADRAEVRAELVREIVAELRRFERVGSPIYLANHIAYKFGGTNG